MRSHTDELALNELAVLDPRQAEIVELRYFGGLTEAEVATTKYLSGTDTHNGQAYTAGTTWYFNVSK